MTARCVMHEIFGFLLLPFTLTRNLISNVKYNYAMNKAIDEAWKDSDLGKAIRSVVESRRAEK